MNRFFILIFILLVNLNTNGFATEQAKTGVEIGEAICSSNDCYQIIEELGEGAFGKVYAVENSTGERFALKSYKRPTELPKETVSEVDSEESNHQLNFMDTLADVQREFLRGQQLDHSHIIKSFDFFTSSTADGEPISFLVLQLVEGKSVYYTKKKAFSQEEVTRAAMQFSDALHYALSQGFFHLDLHENNVMLSDQATAMVIDLASFFTFEEIFGYVKNQTTQAKQEKSPETAQAAVQQALSMDPTRARKLRQFFSHNPGLLERLQQTQTKQKEPLQQAAIAATVSQQVNEFEAARARFHAYYFDNLTGMCLAIISKSNGSREEKIQTYAEIKKLAWNYLEDCEDGNLPPFADYVTKLLEILESSQQ
ncbi:putative secreted protein [Candidatus Protochlamydia naegleriophila]|uniref:Putative secreted protein n=1 Tax=Candidatus Protochlamydia naegleriophila TaxID=389348 RepID=A0A0U5JC66_9BACT|nr:protein kinase [Candidatus Protochlamydia naegleriophila]CUI16701.1 putative secreted protein [Candidatus Protochlamydia naegleriophila]